MRDAIVKRISRRKYINQPLKTEYAEKIKQMIDTLNEQSGLSASFIDDASAAFSSMKKSYGMFAGVRSVIVMKGKNDDKDLAEKIGYYGEELILNLTDMGLGTCWVAGTFDKSKFKISDCETMLCVITVGEVEGQSVKERVIRRSISKNRKAANVRLKGYDEAPTWAKEAMEAVRLAPSAVNSQKPTFCYCGGTITASVADTSPVMLIDLGIAKKHFEIEAGGKFELGNNGRFIKE